jgi:hypothetical protein
VLQVTQGAPIDDEFTLQAQDLTGWTGIATFKAMRISEPYRRDYDHVWLDAEKRTIATVTPGLTIGGGNTVVRTELADTSEFPALPRVGFFVTAFAEIVLTGPTGLKLVFQRPVAVAGAL